MLKPYASSKGKMDATVSNTPSVLMLLAASPDQGPDEEGGGGRSRRAWPAVKAMGLSWD